MSLLIWFPGGFVFRIIWASHFPSPHDPNKRFPGSKQNPGNARGTDRFRALCHQFFPSCLSRRESCLTSSKTFSLKMNKLRGALLLSYNIGGQDQETRQMGDPLRQSRRCCTVGLRRKHLRAKLQITVASHRKRSGVRFVLLVVAPRPL